MARLENKVAVVTGSAAGIGRAIALGFAEEGCSLVLADLDLEGLLHTAHLAEEHGGRVLVFEADVTRRADVEDMLIRAIQELDTIDILVNNAGIFFPAAFDEMTDDQWQRMLDANLTSVFTVSQVVLRHWLALQHAGVIVNISSVSGTVGRYGTTHYCTAKAGVVALTRCLAQEYGERGIRVNAIAPGVIQSRITQAVIADREHSANWLSHIPLRRFGQPSDVAQAALFLASDESSYITGDTLVVDGGWIT